MSQKNITSESSQNNYNSKELPFLKESLGKGSFDSGPIVKEILSGVGFQHGEEYLLNEEERQLKALNLVIRESGNEFSFDIRKLFEEKANIYNLSEVRDTLRSLYPVLISRMETIIGNMISGDLKKSDLEEFQILILARNGFRNILQSRIIKDENTEKRHLEDTGTIKNPFIISPDTSSHHGESGDNNQSFFTKTFLLRPWMEIYINPDLEPQDYKIVPSQEKPSEVFDVNFQSLVRWYYVQAERFDSSVENPDKIKFLYNMVNYLENRGVNDIRRFWDEFNSSTINYLDDFDRRLYADLLGIIDHAKQQQSWTREEYENLKYHEKTKDDFELKAFNLARDKNDPNIKAMATARGIGLDSYDFINFRRDSNVLKDYFKGKEDVYLLRESYMPLMSLLTFLNSYHENQDSPININPKEYSKLVKYLLTSEFYLLDSIFPTETIESDFTAKIYESVLLSRGVDCVITTLQTDLGKKFSVPRNK